MTLFTRDYPPSVFPIYLLPSIPFPRRKRRSIDSTSSGSSGSSGIDTSAANAVYLGGHVSYLRCARCATDLCLSSQIISKGFTGRHGRAYLVSPGLTAGNAPLACRDRDQASCLANTHIHKPVPRQLVTGAHTVCDVSCALCGSVIGWKYEGAEEESQKYKIGKFILETRKTFESSCWEEEEGWKSNEDRPPPMNWHSDSSSLQVEADFDSQDEDECEDLFAGVWNPLLAAKKRKGKVFGRRAGDNFTGVRRTR